MFFSMFLNILNEKQKNLFLKLAIKAAETNDEVTSEEEAMIDAFALEMQIEPIHSTDDALDEILQALKNISTIRDYRIITFEILGILFSDSEFDDKEKDFIKEICDTFGITKETVDEMIVNLNEYTNLFNKIVKLIL